MLGLKSATCVPSTVEISSLNYFCVGFVLASNFYFFNDNIFIILIIIKLFYRSIEKEVLHFIKVDLYALVSLAHRKILQRLEEMILFFSVLLVCNSEHTIVLYQKEIDLVSISLFCCLKL